MASHPAPISSNGPNRLFGIHDAVDPLKEFVKGIVTAVRAVPCQQEVDILAGVLELEGEVDGHGERGVAVAGTMTDVPVRCHVGHAVTDEVHRVHQTHVLTDFISQQ